MDVATAHNVRDKSRMKTVLRDAGVPCARHQLVDGTEEAAGVRATRSGSRWWPSRRPAPGRRRPTGSTTRTRLATPGSRAVRPTPTRPGLLEEFLIGAEHTFDSVTIGGQTVWASISDYQPPPLEVLRNPWIQWTVLLPRDIGGPEYDGIRQIGPAALRALGVRDALDPHGVVPPPRRLGGGLRGRRATARAPSSPRCSASPTTSTSTARGPS